MSSVKNNKLLDFEYATFRKEIKDFFINKLLKKPKTILDPMAGTAPLIPYLETQGHKAYLFDILPIHYHINKLKLYEIRKLFYEHDREIFKRKLLNYMAPLKHKKRIVSADWIDGSILSNLIRAWKLACEEEENIATILKGIIILSIKSFSSFTLSKNPTWIRQGGITSNKTLSEVINNKISLIENYYNAYPPMITKGDCILGINDAKQLHIEEKVDLILTSPPYCNRLDYIKKYSPEHLFLSKVGYPLLKEGLIGTNVVKDYKTFEKDKQWIEEMSPFTYQLIKRIENKKTRDRFYYSKYFTKYFTILLKTYENLLCTLSENGKMYIVVQDNVHRGELIKINKAIEQLFITNGFKCQILHTWERHHLGRRNISKDYRVVFIRQFEKLLMVERG